MSDTVKLIVTLSKGQYENLKDIQFGGIGSRMIFNAVKNGIPLDDVKAEIQASMYCDKDTRLVENANASGLKKALEILDNIGKAESEE